MNQEGEDGLEVASRSVSFIRSLDHLLLKEDGTGNLFVVGSALQVFPAFDNVGDGSVTDFVDHFCVCVQDSWLLLLDV